MPGFNFYQRILMPMWDGDYLNKGKVEKLSPAVFFFAGTTKGLRLKVESTWFRAKCLKTDICYGFCKLMKTKAFLYNEGINIEPSRKNWRKRCRNKLRSLSNDATIPKFLDFYERLDRFIFLPPITLYFIDRDNNCNPYFTDREMIYFFVTKIHKTFSDVKYISKKALAILCSEFYRSRRENGKSHFPIPS